MKYSNNIKTLFIYSIFTLCMTFASSGKCQIKELVSSGGNQMTSQYQLSESVGQVFTHNISESDFYLSEGFQQHHNVKVYKHKQDIHFKIYPNPVKSIVNIESNEKLLHISLYNEFGALIKTYDRIDRIKYQLDLTDLHPGIYFIKLVSSNHNQSIQKLVKS